ncbi:unnamed protein product [Brassica oleracea var. botrytis]|uniref:(rape) hypothetical protein n=1 Tax=Brassica napus TaxID=3708 RepID=A0A816KAW5_BRANA|nr:unnamed protein product [Brassica napus]
MMGNRTNDAAMTTLALLQSDYPLALDLFCNSSYIIALGL